jgi:hypothetical protein
LTDGYLLAIVAQYMCAATDDFDHRRGADDAPSGVLATVFSEELRAFYDRKRAEEPENEEEDKHGLWGIADLCVDFGVKLGAAVASKPPAEATSAVAALLDDFRRAITEPKVA